MLHKVTLRAESIQVTADDESAAERNAREDAAQFAGDWTYEVDDVEPAGEEDVVTTDLGSLSFEVEHIDDEDEIWTFDATVDVVVEAPDQEAAKALAITLPARLRYPDKVPAPTVSPA